MLNISNYKLHIHYTRSFDDVEGRVTRDKCVKKVLSQTEERTRDALGICLHQQVQTRDEIGE